MNRTPEHLLLEAIAARGWSLRHLARELRVSPSIIVRWCAGTRSPSLASAARLEDILGIPMRAWLGGGR